MVFYGWGLPFNSIEWIQRKFREYMEAPQVLTFNSIEWIPGYRRYMCRANFVNEILSIPLNGFC